VSEGDVQVRGSATPDEVAAVLAALRSRERQDERSSHYERWRRDRIKALRDNR
jgi:hypothetical protein